MKLEKKSFPIRGKLIGFVVRSLFLSQVKTVAQVSQDTNLQPNTAVIKPKLKS